MFFIWKKIVDSVESLKRPITSNEIEESEYIKSNGLLLPKVDSEKL